MTSWLLHWMPWPMKSSISFAIFTTLTTCVATFRETWTWTTRSLYTSMLLRVLPLTVYFALAFDLPKCENSHLLGLNFTCHFSAHFHRWIDILWQPSSLSETSPILVLSANLQTNPSTFTTKLFIYIYLFVAKLCWPQTTSQINSCHHNSLHFMSKAVLNPCDQVIMDPTHLDLLDQSTMEDFPH